MLRRTSHCTASALAQEAENCRWPMSRNAAEVCAAVPDWRTWVSPCVRSCPSMRASCCCSMALVSAAAATGMVRRSRICERSMGILLCSWGSTCSSLI